MASPESLEPPGRRALPVPPVPLTPGSKEPKGRLGRRCRWCAVAGAVIPGIGALTPGMVGVAAGAGVAAAGGVNPGIDGIAPGGEAGVAAAGLAPGR